MEEQKFNASNLLNTELDILFAVVEGVGRLIGSDSESESSVDFALYVQFDRMKKSLNKYFEIIDAKRN